MYSWFTWSLYHLMSFLKELHNARVFLAFEGVTDLVVMVTDLYLVRNNITMLLRIHFWRMIWKFIILVFGRLTSTTYQILSRKILENKLGFRNFKWNSSLPIWINTCNLTDVADMSQFQQLED